MCPKEPTVSELIARLHALVSELDAPNRTATIIARPNTLNEVASKTLRSFNLCPTKSFESSLKSINYSTSIEHALARDWQNIGNDLWNKHFAGKK